MQSPAPGETPPVSPDNDNHHHSELSSSSTSTPTKATSIRRSVERPIKNPAKQNEFHQLFKLDEDVIEDYTCAYNGDAILYHGRMYITRNHVCFYSQIFKTTIKIINFKDILDICKRNTALVFPNAIEFTTSKTKLTFASFVYRD